VIAHTLFLSISSLTSPHIPHPSPVHASGEAARLKDPFLQQASLSKRASRRVALLKRCLVVVSDNGGTVHVCCKH
jgi:hypothetical protein